MYIRETQLSVNDYLDLYLYAESMNDSLWQFEILEKLQSCHTENKKEAPTFIPKYILDKYKNINEEIRSIYRQLHSYSPNHSLLEKVQELKQQRISLSHQVQLIKKHSLQIM